MKSSEKWVFVDYLKSISMLYIVGFWHLLRYTNAFPAYRTPVTETIAYVVTLGLFTFISGFLNGKSVLRSSGTLDFYIKKVVRIYPLYVGAIFLFYVSNLNDGITSLKSLFCVSMLYGPAPLTLWFVTTIVLFYLIAPILVRYARDVLKYILVVASFAAFAIALFAVTAAVDVRIILYFPCFCLGIYCAVNDVENRFVNIRHAIVLLLASLIFYAIEIELPAMTILKKILLMVSSSYLIFAIGYKNNKIFPHIGFISFLSYSSYAMYLFHRPIYVGLKALFFPNSGMLQVFYLVGFGLSFVTLIAWTLQRANDRLFTAANPWLQRASFFAAKEP